MMVFVVGVSLCWFGYGMAWGELYFSWSVFLLWFWILWLLGYTVTTLYGFVSKHGSMVMFLDVIFTNTDSPGCMIASFALLFLSMYVLRCFLYCASLWSILDGSEVFIELVRTLVTCKQITFQMEVYLWLSVQLFSNQEGRNLSLSSSPYFH